MKNVNTSYKGALYIAITSLGKVYRTDLWGEPVADRVHVVAGC